jgi:hypothetical protein
MENNSHELLVIGGKLDSTQPLTREMLHARTRELRAGRVPPEVNQLDHEQAKRELTDESEIDRQDAMFRLAFDSAENRSGEEASLLK